MEWGGISLRCWGTLQKIVENFLTLLKKNQDIKKAKEIVALTENILLKKTGNKKVMLEMARKNSVVLRSVIKKNDIVEEKINPALIAGIKIIIDEEKQLDFSLQKKLNKIF